MSLSETVIPSFFASCSYSLLWIRNCVAFVFRFARSTVPGAGYLRFVALKLRLVCSSSASHCAFVIVSLPTTATASGGTSFGPPLPHAATSSTTATPTRIRPIRLMEKAPAAGIFVRLPDARRV
jgi:hypothetical protein